MPEEAPSATIKIPAYHPSQATVMAEARRFNVLACGRRYGKTTAGIRRLLLPAIHGYPTAWFAPNYKLMAEVWLDVKNRTKPIQRRVSNQDKRIELVTGGVIDMWSLDGDIVVRGRKYKHIGVDEAAFIPNLGNVWIKAILPTLADYGGSADFYSCVTADTRVATERGLLRLGELCSDRIPGTFTPLGVSLAGFHGDPQLATQFYVSGHTPTKRVVTRSGYVLEGTFHHPVWAMRGEYPAWTRLDALTPGDYVAIRRGTGLWGNDDDLTGFRVAYPKRANGSGMHPVTVAVNRMSKDLSYLMGLILGDGYVDAKLGRINIARHGEEVETHAFLAGNPLNLRFKHIDDQHQQASSMEFARFLTWYGFSPLLRAKEKRIPDRLWRASQETVASFLSGLFDADGCASARKGVISFTSASRGLALDVQQLLLNFGIVTRWREHAVHPSAKVKSSSYVHVLELSPKESKLFYDRIGFRLTRKQIRRTHLPQTTEARSWSRDGVPHQQERIRRIRKGCWFQGNVTKGFVGLDKSVYVGYAKLREFLNRTAHTTAVADWQALKTLECEEYYWDPVISVTSGAAETFDVVVPTTHAFVSNGFISHNTPNGLNMFHSLYQMGQDPEMQDWMSWTRTTFDNPYIDPKEIEILRANMTEKAFAQEIMAEFLADGTVVFRYVKQAATALPEGPLPGRHYAIGVDWGRTDYTVFTVMDIADKRMVHMERTNQLEFALQRGRLLALCERYKPDAVVIEENSIGLPIIEQLRRDKLYVHSFLTTNSSKMRIIDNLALHFERGAIKILNDTALINELYAFTAEKLPSGVIRYAAPEGLHDDMVISLALTLEACGKPDGYLEYLRGRAKEIKDKQDEAQQLIAASRAA